MTRSIALTAAVVIVGLASPLLGQTQPAGKEEANLAQLVNANVIATHAYQVLLAQQPDKKADAECFAAGGLTKEQLQALVDHQKALLASPAEEVKAWAAGQASKFDPAKDLQPILGSRLDATGEKVPVNAVAKWLRFKAPTAHAPPVKALASVFQMMLDVERDADTLQDMFRLYHALGLPVHLGQIGITANTDEEFLAFGDELSPKFCACPFKTDPKTLRMMFRKLYNWGRRYTGERDKAVLARELLAEDDVKALVPLLQKLPPQKIAVIGHSFTMGVHWASPSAFVPVVGEIFKTVNPKVEVRQWEAGGLTAVRAYSKEKFYEQALAWKPDRVLLVVAANGRANEEAMKAMVDGFAAAGVEVMVFDRLWPLRKPKTAPATASAPVAAPTTAPVNPLAKAHVIEVGRILGASPDEPKFEALDGVHMTEPWHRLMAKEWLKYLVGARKEKAEP